MKNKIVTDNSENNEKLKDKSFAQLFASQNSIDQPYTLPVQVLEEPDILFPPPNILEMQSPKFL